jgi:hypothetical protein
MLLLALDDFDLRAKGIEAGRPALITALNFIFNRAAGEKLE